MSTLKINNCTFLPINRNEFQKILKKNKQGCLFCNPNSKKKIIFETKNFFVTVDDSPLLDGHLLIHSKEHLSCGAEIPFSLYKEYKKIKKTVSQLLVTIYGSIAFYEHGRAGHCTMVLGEVMCEHFHLHALPFKQNISNLLNTSFKEIKVKTQKQIHDLYEQYDQYLYFETHDNRYFYIVTNKIPSHYLRTIIANTLDTSQKADWIDCTDLDSINRFKKELKKRYE